MKISYLFFLYISRSMQNNKTSGVPEDEIDLRSLGQKLYELLSYPFVLFGRYFKTSLGFFIAAILLAFLCKLIVPKSYTTSFVLRPVDHAEKLHLKVLSDLETLVKVRDNSALSKALDLDSSITRELVAIESFNSISKGRTDSVNYTEVVLKATDYRHFLSIQDAVICYLESNPYYSKIRTLQQQQVEMEQSEVEKDLKRLDSLKALQLREKQGQALSPQNMVLLSQLSDPMTTYRTSSERVAKRSELMARKAFIENFQLVKSCVITRHPSSPPRMLILCLYFIPVAMLLCFFFLAVKELRLKRRA